MADRSVVVRLSANIAQYKAAMASAGRDTDAFGNKLKRTDATAITTQRSIDRLSGRIRLFGEAAATVGPAFISLSAGAVPALAGVTAGLTAVASAAGVALLAFKGVGDGLKALDTYQLDPTAENLAKLHVQMAKLGPDGAHFVRVLDSLEPQLRSLQLTARHGLFPGVEQGLDDILHRMPQVRQIIANVSTELGDVAAGAGRGLASSRFTDFFDYLETDAAPTLRAFAVSTGNVAEGIGHLVVAFAPLSRDFTSGLEKATEDFAAWTAGLSQTQGFHDFVDYVRESGPQAAEFLGAISSAFIGIIRAAAPFGQATLPILTDLAHVLATIADSPIGPPLFTAAAAFLALNRAVKVLGPGLASLNAAMLDLRTSPNVAATAVERFGRAAKIATGAAGMGLFVTSLSETNHHLKTFEGVAGGALAGFSVGGPWGAAIGGAIGLVSSFGQANKESAGYVDALTSSLDHQTGALTESSRAVAAKALEDQGLLKVAQGLGINLDTVTSAALGNKDALNEVNSELERFANVETPAGVDQEMLKQRLEGEKLHNALMGLSSDSNSTIESQKRMAAAAAETGSAFTEQAIGLRTARDAARETGGQFITLGKDVDNAKVSLSGWIKQLADQAAALEGFTHNALRAAHRGLDEGLISSLKKAGPEGALRMKQLADGTDSELARANSAWRRGQAAIERYARLTVPAKKVDVNTDPAMSGIRAVQAALARLHGKHLTISIVRQEQGLAHAADAMDAHARAGGGTVPGARRPYGDKTLIFAAPGEEVITNRHGEADRFRADRASGLIPHYAAGGTVAPKLTAGQRKARSQAAAVGRADEGFDLQGGMTTKEVRHELQTFAHEIHKAGYALGKNFGDLGDRAVKLSQQYKTNADALDKARSDRDSLRQAASTSFMHDPFTVNGNAASLADFNTQVGADTADAKKMRAALDKARKKGLDGPLAAAIGSSGNLLLAEQFAGLSKAQIRQEEKAFGGRTVANNALGQSTVDASGLPKQVNDLVHANHLLVKRLNGIEDRIEGAVRRGAYDGTAQREQSHNRSASARSRVGR